MARPGGVFPVKSTESALVSAAVAAAAPASVRSIGSPGRVLRRRRHRRHRHRRRRRPPAHRENAKPTATARRLYSPSLAPALSRDRPAARRHIATTAIHGNDRAARNYAPGTCTTGEKSNNNIMIFGRSSRCYRRLGGGEYQNKYTGRDHDGVLGTRQRTPRRTCTAIAITINNMR